MIDKATAPGVELALAKLAWGKNDVAFSLHVTPNTYSTAGIQLPDFLNYLGFSRQPCTFLGSECYCKEVRENFDIKDFGAKFTDGYEHLSQAERHLNNCGFALNQID